ncbi:hypothetical protein B0H34DRAFT_796922 [Crassisporium funariophilum]|nr:hypothetical protein B0H34DRAFT_796922 [Crassisporium funariophilum]
MGIIKKITGRWKRIPFEGLTENDRVIILIGPTGVGKSSFINTATNGDLLPVHHEVTPCKTEITHIAHTPQEGGRQVVFVDTPALPEPDSKYSEAEIEELLSQWLKKAFTKKIKVAGFLYLHRITDNRATEPPRPHLRMIGHLCGLDSRAKALLVTTMWQIEDAKIAVQREEELVQKWSPLSGGSKATRYDGTHASAWSVVKLLLGEDIPTPRDEVRIAVMGLTGSGKSTFIKIATGIDTGVGHALESCTNTVNVFRLPFQEFSTHDVVFIDTPGFDVDDSEGRTEVEVLKMLSDWLKERNKGPLVSKLLYFHRIPNPRFAGSPLTNIDMYKALCALENIVLVTTMWDEENIDVAIAREKELVKKYWAELLKRGATIARFKGTRPSAFSIMGLDKPDSRQ